MSCDLSTKTPVSGGGWWKMGGFRGRHFIGFAVCWTFATVGAAAVPADRTVEVRPPHFSLNAMLNEPVVFQVEVNAPDSLGELDLKADGLRIQREIKDPAPDRRLFLVEPDTSAAGRVNGSIAVVKKDRTVMGRVAVTGEVRPYIRLSPNRIFLGSLEYGTHSASVVERKFRVSADTDWSITGVDVSDIPEADCVVQELDSRTRELCFRFPEEALKSGQPFGAFIAKTIRVHTSLSAQPELTIPIVALLSKNGTARDFNTFVFKGNERWQGIWGTPNIAAAVIGPLILGVLGYGMWLLRPGRSLARPVGVILCAIAAFGMVLLVKTYSRGGWLAFGVGLLGLFILMPGRRRMIAIAGGCAIAIVIALPAGLDRVASVGGPSEDLSIRNRLLVWRGALEMIADHPVRGVGRGQFGQQFRDYYQEPWHNGEYSTAINDSLTLAAEKGVFPAVAALAAGMFLFVATTQLMSARREIWLAPVACGLLALSVSSCFSSISFVRDVRVLAVASAMILFAYSVRAICQGPRSPAPSGAGPWACLRSGLLAAVGVTLLFGGCLFTAHALRSVRYLTSDRLSVAGVVQTRLEYLPGRGIPRGVVVYLPEQVPSLPAAGRFVLRRLAQQGWRPILLKLPEYDQEAEKELREQLRGIRGPVVFLAEGGRARVALGAARDMPIPQPAFVFIEPKLASALPECNKALLLPVPAWPSKVISRQQWKLFEKGEMGAGQVISEGFEAIVPNTAPISYETRGMQDTTPSSVLTPEIPLSKASDGNAISVGEAGLPRE